jgi:hypothetical protein
MHFNAHGFRPLFASSNTALRPIMQMPFAISCVNRPKEIQMNVTSLTNNASSLSPATTSPSTGSGTSFQALLNTKKSGSTAAADSIAAYVKMTPAQRMGLTEEDLKKMPPDQAKATETKIADLVKMQMQQNAPKAQTAQGIKGLSLLG